MHAKAAFHSTSKLYDDCQTPLTPWGLSSTQAQLTMDLQGTELMFCSHTNTTEIHTYRNTQGERQKEWKHPCVGHLTSQPNRREKRGSPHWSWTKSANSRQFVFIPFSLISPVCQCHYIFFISYIFFLSISSFRSSTVRWSQWQRMAFLWIVG